MHTPLSLFLSHLVSMEIVMVIFRCIFSCLPRVRQPSMFRTRMSLATWKSCIRNRIWYVSLSSPFGTLPFSVLPTGGLLSTGLCISYHVSIKALLIPAVTGLVFTGKSSIGRSIVLHDLCHVITYKYAKSKILMLNERQACKPFPLTIGP